PARLLAALLAGGALAACGGSETTVGLGGTTDFTVASCALGCNQPGPTGKLKCEAAQIKVNQEIWAEFTQAVDPGSVSKTTFKVTNTLTGKTPTGTYVVDPNNPRRVIFKPSLSFDSNGNPKFGLDEGGNYEIDIPGSETGAGPYIRSTTGEPNGTGVQCFVIATGKSDAVPGPPNVRVFVDPLGVEIENLTDPVELDSSFRFEFDDLMNAATLVNPSTGKSGTLQVALDLDGNTQDPSDQLEIPGSFTITFNETVKTTTVVFTPVAGFPSSGSLGERRVVVTLPPTITDVADNPLDNAGTFVVTTESVAQVVGSLEEDFVTDDLIDDSRTGTNLTVVGNIGLVSASNGGGSGRLGDLLVSSGQTVTLVTDGTTIGDLDAPKFGPPQPVPPELIDPEEPDEFLAFLIDNYDPDVDTPGSQVIVVTDGVFEFANVIVRGTLRFVGANPPRLFARGTFEIDGAIDVAGVAAAGHSSEKPLGSAGGAG
ncbi:MAG TPA: hypothetical protein VJP77_07115, partial [Planctomycetota bacterium]|nr:hypothetical protein [Planctomycetota bacterium]